MTTDLSENLMCFELMCLRNKKYHYDLENGHISV